MITDVPNLACYTDCLFVLYVLVLNVLVYQTVFVIVIVYQCFVYWCFMYWYCCLVSLFFVQSCMCLYLCMLYFCFNVGCFVISFRFNNQLKILLTFQTQFTFIPYYIITIQHCRREHGLLIFIFIDFCGFGVLFSCITSIIHVVNLRCMCSIGIYNKC